MRGCLGLLRSSELCKRCIHQLWLQLHPCQLWLSSLSSRRRPRRPSGPTSARLHRSSLVVLPRHYTPPLLPPPPSPLTACSSIALHTRVWSRQRAANCESAEHEAAREVHTVQQGPLGGGCLLPLLHSLVPATTQGCRPASKAKSTGLPTRSVPDCCTNGSCEAAPATAPGAVHCPVSLTTKGVLQPATTAATTGCCSSAPPAAAAAAAAAAGTRAARAG